VQEGKTMSQQLESALVVLVPESEALVKPLRERCDPSAALGVPAHITILYPFKPPYEITPVVRSALQVLFRRFLPFAFSLPKLRAFPGVLYLAPTPSDPFVALTKAVSDAFPETLPYRGEFTDIIPHLTVAHFEDDEQLKCLTAEIESAMRSHPPIQATATEVTLLDNAHGLWQVRAVFHLGDRGVT
jgi:hypothetical protein